MDELNYEETIARIKARFPNGTVKTREDNGRAYIPNQVYTDRVERETGSRWDREIKEVEINIPHGYVKVIARVTIGPHYRDGVGFAEISVEPNGKAKQLANKVDLALNEAVREALDTWQIGWRNLAAYHQQDWGGNPALAHLLETAPHDQLYAGSKPPSTSVERFCIFADCGAKLSREEWALLGKVPNLNRDKLTYCYKHLPAHMKRKLPEELRSRFDTV
ncbi:MAG: hypothetical protein K0Q59_3207 [Paenibacillus sp.]|nr:hypothetical protein [Paenibacillus sp.]